MSDGFRYDQLTWPSHPIAMRWPAVRTDLWATFAAFAGGLRLAGEAGMIGGATAAERDDRPQPGRHVRRSHRDGEAATDDVRRPFDIGRGRAAAPAGAAPAHPTGGPGDHPRLP